MEREKDVKRKEHRLMCVLGLVFWTSYLNVHTQRTVTVLYVNTEIASYFTRVEHSWDFLCSPIDLRVNIENGFRSLCVNVEVRCPENTMKDTHRARLVSVFINLRVNIEYGCRSLCIQAVLCVYNQLWHLAFSMLTRRSIGEHRKSQLCSTCVKKEARCQSWLYTQRTACIHRERQPYSMLTRRLMNTEDGSCALPM